MRLLRTISASQPEEDVIVLGAEAMVRPFLRPRWFDRVATHLRTLWDRLDPLRRLEN